MIKKPNTFQGRKLHYTSLSLLIHEGRSKQQQQKSNVDGNGSVFLKKPKRLNCSMYNYTHEDLPTLITEMP